MRSLLKRGLPFALTLLIGLAMTNLVRRAWPPRLYVGRIYCFGESHGRDVVYSPRDVDQKARILSRPEPTYTDAARENLLEGTVVLRAVFSEDGVVRNIRVVKELPDGLTEMAMQAALGIKFSPAMKNGRPVSQNIQIEYNFSLF